jgi:hypothetical protein
VCSGYTCNPSTLESEIEGPQFEGQTGISKKKKENKQKNQKEKCTVCEEEVVYFNHSLNVLIFQI